MRASVWSKKPHVAYMVNMGFTWLTPRVSCFTGPHKGVKLSPASHLTSAQYSLTSYTYNYRASKTRSSS